MKLRWLALAVALAATGGCSAAATADPPPAASGGAQVQAAAQAQAARPQAAAAQPPDAVTASSTPSVGALFSGTGGGHFCTASVVASPGEDLLITAAHCINGGTASGGAYSQDLEFIPGYRDGQAPYGVWKVKQLLVAPQWITGSDPDLDVGFAVVAPNDGRTIQDVVGASQLGTDSGYRYQVRVTGYPDGANAPISCVNWTSEESATQLQFDCGSFTDGTSGSPWITNVNPGTGTGTIVGIIGGYQQGGDTPAISYSSYLGSAVQSLYQEAAADEGGTTG
jgi:V8-like Glu-specific endopeptidase